MYSFLSLSDSKSEPSSFLTEDREKADFGGFDRAQKAFVGFSLLKIIKFLEASI